MLIKLVRPISDILVYIGCSFTVILGNSAFHFFELLTIALGTRAIFSHAASIFTPVSKKSKLA